MKKPGAILLVFALAAVFAGVLVYLFHRQLAGGDVYPAYSSLRSDPAGAKLIFESLRRLPGVTAIRSYQPLDRLPDRASTILLLGMDPRGFAVESAAELQSFEELAGRGNRLVFGMRSGSGRAPARQSALELKWGVRFGLRFDKDGDDVLYFAEAKDWEILGQDGQRPVAIEKTFGSGSVVLVAAGRIFGNQAVAEGGGTALLTRIIGTHARILFDETHFGIVESGSIVALARRYRLHGFAVGLAICAALFIWKNSSSFPPISNNAPAEEVQGRTSVAGLVTLLRRHIPPERFIAVCWEEWLKTNARQIPAARREQAESVVRNSTDRPAEALREIQTILHAKGAI